MKTLTAIFIALLSMGASSQDIPPIPLPMPRPGTALPNPGGKDKVVVKSESARSTGLRTAADSADSSSAKIEAKVVDPGASMESGATDLIFGFANAEGVLPSEVFGGVLPNPANPFDNSAPDVKDDAKNEPKSEPKDKADSKAKSDKEEKPAEKKKVEDKPKATAP